jgi:saccharopine dehydrogenase (NAD+, L-lysine-forming)
LTIKAWAYQQKFGDKPLPGVDAYTSGRGYYETEDEMLEQLSVELKEASEKAGHSPRVFVMSALA